MGMFRSNWLKYVFMILILILFESCKNPPGPNGYIYDKDLSPPIIAKPIYTCAEIIAFSGVDRNSKVIVYVDGNYVTERNTWWHWGWIKLPITLGKNQEVSAKQVVYNRISEETRDPVTVEDIPPGFIPGGKLATPKVVPHLIKCQQLVLVDDVLPGATVTIKDNNSKTWEEMTPRSSVRIVTLELELGWWYKASQSICEDPPYDSAWSAEQQVIAINQPFDMPTANIQKPLVAGHDACIVDNLIFGAEVDIYEVEKDNDSEPDRVGGGIAYGESSIFRISKTIDANYEYYAIQSLCDLYSTPSAVTPVTTVPAPTVQDPICHGEKYVKICDNIPVATIMVYVGGNKVAQASGGIGCVTIALGDNTYFSENEEVTAKHWAAGKLSADSDPVFVTMTGVPPYDPSSWNDDPEHIKNNCYSYACNIMINKFGDPGQAGGITMPKWSDPNSPDPTCPELHNAILADGLKLLDHGEEECATCEHKVALFISKGKAGDTDYKRDYHFYRLDDTGFWSSKHGYQKVTNLDASDKPIEELELEDADHNYDFNYGKYDYKFCNYYCVDKKIVSIEGD